MPAFILADNQPLTANGLQWAIARLYATSKVYTASNKQQLLGLLAKHSIDGVVLDYSFFDLTSTEDLRNISLRYPSVQWLLVQHEYTDRMALELEHEQSLSFLTKECTHAELSDALLATIAKQRYVCAAVRKQWLHATRPLAVASILTPAEQEVLALIAQGMTVKAIATARHSSTHTIVTHKKNIFRKLQVSTIHEATRIALRLGLVEADYFI